MGNAAGLTEPTNSRMVGNPETIRRGALGIAPPLSPSVQLSRVLGSLGRFMGYAQNRLGLREIGGILTSAYLLSYHVFCNLHETRINTGDFYGLAFFNSFNCSA